MAGSNYKTLKKLYYRMMSSAVKGYSLVMKLMNSDTHSWTHSLASFAIYDHERINLKKWLKLLACWEVLKNLCLLKMVAYLACLWNWFLHYSGHICNWQEPILMRKKYWNNATQIKIEISSQLLKLHAWRNHDNPINMFARKTKEQLHVRYMKHPINLMTLPVLWEYHLVPFHHHPHRHVLRHLHFLLNYKRKTLKKEIYTVENYHGITNI